jgi:hypothetical protein
LLFYLCFNFGNFKMIFKIFYNFNVEIELN